MGKSFSMNEKQSRSLAALFLALVMLLVAPFTALAEDPPDPNTHNIVVVDQTVYVYNDNNEPVKNIDLSENPVLEGDLEPEKPAMNDMGYEPALKITTPVFDNPSTENQEEGISFTVNGSVSYGIDTNGQAIAVYSDADSVDATVVVNGDVNATATLEYVPGGYPLTVANGIAIRGLPGSTSSATINGDVTAVATAKEGYTIGEQNDGFRNTTGNATNENESDENKHETAKAWERQHERQSGNAAELNMEPGEARAFAVWGDAAGPGAVSKIHVTGDAVARSEGEEDKEMNETHTVAVMAVGELTGSVTIDIDGKASASSTEHSFSAQAVQAETLLGGEVDITIREGAEGQVFLGAQTDGTTKLNIASGGVNATIAEPSDDASLAALWIVNGTYEEPEEKNNPMIAPGTIEATIIGDVTASGAPENIGIQLQCAEGGKTDIIVDGTVSASDAAVVLVTPETQIGENVTLTVWELNPNQDGAVVTSVDENDKLVENEEAEKAVQYIIKIQAGQEGIISAEGTREYEGYQVANEGDTVTMKLTIPEGFEVAGAYGDEGQEWPLSKVAGGNYYLSVPRGGGVMLSVKLSKKEDPKTDPKTEEEAAVAPAPAPVEAAIQTILKILDKTGKVSISFFSNGNYMVKYENGASEYGQVTLNDAGEPVLINNKAPLNPMPMTLNTARNLYELKFVPSGDATKTYEFDIAPSDVQALIQNRK